MYASPRLEMADVDSPPIVTLEDVIKEIKAMRKDFRKVKNYIEDPTGEKAKARSENNGFRKPQKVTPELAAFLGLAADERISRSAVTKRFNQYFEKNNLKSGQNISLDATLKTLLNPPEDLQLTFLNIQTYINKHYVKEEKPPVEKKPRAIKASKAAAAAEAPAPAPAPLSATVSAPAAIETPAKPVRPKVAKKPKVEGTATA